MKNKITAVISIVVCLLMVISAFTACSVKKGENGDNTTLTPDDNWRPGDEQAYQPMEITDVELVKLVNKALGDEAKGFNGDLSSLTDEQMKKVREEAKKEGYIVETDSEGDPVIKKEPVTEVSSELYDEILSEADVENPTGLTPSEYEKVSQIAEEKGATAITNDDGSVTIVRRITTTAPTATNPGTPTNPTNPGNTNTSALPTGVTGVTNTPQSFSRNEVGTVAPKTTAVLPAFSNSYSNGTHCLFQSTDMTSDGAVSVGNTLLNSSGKVQEFSSALLVKFNEKGKRAWSDVLSADDMTGYNDVAVLKDGSVIAVGYTVGENIVPDSQYKCKGSVEGVMVKYSAKGERLWTKLFGGSGGDEIYCVAAAPDGGYVMGGSTTSKDFDLKNTSSAENKAFVAKYNADGNLQWVKTMGGSKNCTTEDVAVSDQGIIFASIQALCIDGDMATFKGPSAGHRYTVAVKYNPDGTEGWKKCFYDEGNVLLNSICTGNDSGCVLAGYYSSRVEGNKGTFKGIYNGGQPGTYDGAVIKLDGNGTKVWLTPIIGFQSDYLTGISKVNGGYAVTGYTTSTNRDFAFTNKGEYDGYVYVISNYGKLQASTSFAGSEVDRALGISSNGTDVFVCGASTSADGSFADCDYKSNGTDSIGFLFKFNLQQ